MQLIKSETRDVISAQPKNKQRSILSNEDALSSIQELPISQSPEPERSLTPLDDGAGSAPGIIISDPESKVIFAKIQNDNVVKTKNVNEITSESSPIESAVQQQINGVAECEVVSAQVSEHVTTTDGDGDGVLHSIKSDILKTVDSSVSETKSGHVESQTIISRITTENGDASGSKVTIGEITTSSAEPTQDNLIVSAQTFIKSYSEISSPSPTTKPFHFDKIKKQVITPQNSVDESVLLQDHSSDEMVRSENKMNKSQITEATLLAVAEKVSKSESNDDNQVVSTQVVTGSHSESSKLHEELTTTVHVISSSQTSKIDNDGNFVVITEIKDGEYSPSTLEASEKAGIVTHVKDEPHFVEKLQSEHQTAGQIISNISSNVESSNSEFHEETTSSSTRIVSVQEKVLSSKIETSGETIETMILTGASPSDIVDIKTFLSEPTVVESNLVTSEQHVTTSSTVTTTSKTEVNGEVNSSSAITFSTEASPAVNIIYSEIINDGTNVNGLSSEAAIESGIVRPPLYKAPNHVWSELLQANPTKIETYLSTEVSSSKSSVEVAFGN